MKDGSCGTVVWALRGLALVVTLLHSSSAAKHLSTWLCRQVYLPCIRLVLQLTKMCLRDAGTAHRGQAGSSPSQRFRFVGEGRTSYVALMMKLNLFDSMLHSSLHVIFLLSTPSHLIQQPCLAWDIALAHLAAASWWLTSSTTRCRRSVVVAFCQVGFITPRPKPPLPCWT